MRLCGFYESSPTRVLQLYCGPYVKFEDPTFDDFNAIKTLTKTYQWISFLTLMVVKMMSTLPFFFLTISTMFTTLVMMVLQVHNLSPRKHSNKL
jgi:hypothetical protein